MSAATSSRASLTSSGDRFERAASVLLGSYSLNYYYGSFISKALRYYPAVGGKNFNAHEVFPNVFVGDVYAAHNAEELKKRGITHIVNCVVGVQPPYPNDFKYLHVQLLDCATESIHKHFEATSAFIKNALENNGVVLVHCLKGVSRSATIATAFVMTALGISPREAVQVLQQSRSIIKPNSGFMLQLEWYHATLNKKAPTVDAEYLRRNSACF